MSIIAKFEAMPNRVRALTRVVAFLGEAPEDKLRALIMPPTGPEDERSDQFSNLLSVVVELGLVQKAPKKIVKLADGITADDAVDDQWFLKHVTQVLLNPAERNADKSPFPYALAWLLAQSPGTEIQWISEQTTEMRRQMSGADVYDVTNENRFAMLCYWARFMGYATGIRLNKQRVVVPDPSAVLARMIPNLCGKGEEVAITDLMAEIAKQTPVLEGGPVRTEVDRRFKDARPERQLSPATSVALARLQRRGLIKQKLLDDATAWTTSQITADGSLVSDERYSHISC